MELDTTAPENVSHRSKVEELEQFDIDSLSDEQLSLAIEYLMDQIT